MFSLRFGNGPFNWLQRRPQQQRKPRRARAAGEGTATAGTSSGIGVSRRGPAAARGRIESLAGGTPRAGPRAAGAWGPRPRSPILPRHARMLCVAPPPRRPPAGRFRGHPQGRRAGGRRGGRRQRGGAVVPPQRPAGARIHLRAALLAWRLCFVVKGSACLLPGWGPASPRRRGRQVRAATGGAPPRWRPNANPPGARSLRARSPDTRPRRALFALSPPAHPTTPDTLPRAGPRPEGAGLRL
jgi:hypothetical protein